MSRTIVIAEAGVNHNGSLKLAKELVDVAAGAGADYVKFQTFKAEQLVTKHAAMAPYQEKNTSEYSSQHSMLRALEFQENDHYEIFNHCVKKNIKFLSTAFDIESLNFLDQFDMDYIKISSGDLNNYLMLREVSKKNKKIILSTGMATLNDVSASLALLKDFGVVDTNIVVLHCTTNYPASYSSVNMNAMITIRDELNIKVGYSDHTLGIMVPIVAVSMGATIIEKHFTLDKKMPGPDHAASLDPLELSEMIKNIRVVEKIQGSKIKQPDRSELLNMPVVRKSIVATKHIKKGEIFSENNLTIKRPGTGISPMDWNSVLGTKSKYDFLPDDLIKVS